jgi:hypothetical protein
MKKLLLTAFLLLSLAYLAWPYAVLWELDQALLGDEGTPLAELVDMVAVRAEITRKLNRDPQCAVGEVSNRFVDWLQEGIRRLGSRAVEQLVTLEWVQAQLLSKRLPGDKRAFLPQVSYAYFEGYDRFLVRIGTLGEAPVYFLLRLEGLVWRVTAVYY